jgi:hypothetical protein
MPDNNHTPVTKADFEIGMKALREYIDTLRDSIDTLRDYIDERTRDMQTELLRGFRTYQESMSIKMAKLSADVGNIDTATDRRLNIVEERLAELERRIAQKGL